MFWSIEHKAGIMAIIFSIKRMIMKKYIYFCNYAETFLLPSAFGKD